MILIVCFLLYVAGWLATLIWLAIKMDPLAQGDARALREREEREGRP